MKLPHTLYLSLVAPAAIRVEESDWNLSKPLTIAGIEVAGNDTPWCGLADLLIDRSTRAFVGVTFSVQQYDVDRVKQLTDRLDRNVVHFEDITMPSFREKYRDWGDAYRFEIRWASGLDLACEGAQLICGQWFWWYPLVDGEIRWERPVAYGISDVQAILQEHKLTFPDISHLPLLDVEYR